MSSSSDPQSMPPPDADFFLNEDHQRLTKNLFLKVIHVPDWVQPQESLAIDFYIPQIQLEHPEWEFEDIPLFMLQDKIEESTGLSTDQYALYKVPVSLRENLNKQVVDVATFRSMGIAPDNTLIVAKLRRGGGRKRKSRLKKKRTKKRRRKTKRRVKRRRGTRRR